MNVTVLPFWPRDVLITYLNSINWSAGGSSELNL